MSREQLLGLSRRISELEVDVRRVRHPSGILDGLAAAQAAISRLLARTEMAEREELPPVEPVPDASAVLASCRAHLVSAGRGGQALLGRRAGVPASTLAKFLRTGRISEAQLIRLAAELVQAGRSR